MNKGNPADTGLSSLEKTEPVTGGPVGDFDPSAGITSPVDSNPADPVDHQKGDYAAPEPKPVYFNGRKFNNQDELLSYVSELERQKRDWEGSSQREDAPPAVKSKKIGDLIWENPEEALAMVEDRATQRALNIIQQQNHTKDVVTQFYGKYTDLKDHEDLVDFYATKLSNDIKDLPLEQRMEKVAHTVRSRLGQIRGDSGGEQRILSSHPTTVAGHGSGPSPRVATVVQPVSFLDQVRKLQRRK